ncbi:uncharacterized protein LOC102708108 [Oryza brachyantha]|uniref:DUF4220 domain-containing protein n=1 Tax=Oryza brachyantha TaxID=4533 RepID=J3N9B9_ORYBR|nr:uncharacterized protein LOC102708108 [Oryza brachyantha]XP_040385078.1 uncharacterized protein LOC102708108 [Oryza brachyantha]
MGNVQQDSASLVHQLRDLWESPRGTVLRIEALAMVAIALSFFLAVFGSCRRWSNRWVLQKGFWAANSLSLSLGTYSIGLMQSSSVKSEMYPVWGVSLLTIFGCVDPITSYSLDYNSQLWQIIYKICLYCGYVLLMSMSTISNQIGNAAVGVLSAVAFIKAFHRSLALVMPIGIKYKTKKIADHMSSVLWDDSYRTEDLYGYPYVLDWYIGKDRYKTPITIEEIWQCKDYHVSNCRDVCLSYSLSNLLQRRYFGFHCAESENHMTHDFVFKGLFHKRDDGVLDYKRAFKVIEVELAFVYDTFFTSNTFLRFNQAEAASIWSFASVIGICFVGVMTLNSSMRSTGRNSGRTIVVGTTKADLIITLVILVSLALVQLLQFIRCWTSNWARVAFAYSYIKNEEKGNKWINPWMGLKAHLTRITCFDSYLWQNKLGQYSFVDALSRRKSYLLRPSRFRGYLCLMFGLHYLAKVLRDMLYRETGHAIELHDDVKESIAEFLYKNGNHIRTDGSTFLDESGLGSTTIPIILRKWSDVKDISNILVWHIGTCYCELAQRQNGFFRCFQKDNGYLLNEEERKYHGVATALSKYYAYLLVSAPQLVLEDVNHGETTCRELRSSAGLCLSSRKRNKLEAMNSFVEYATPDDGLFSQGVELGKQLNGMSRCWKIAADFWIEALLYAAPSDSNVEEHVRHLSKGGEFITHLWALLSHAGILSKKEAGQRRGGEAIV